MNHTNHKKDPGNVTPDRAERLYRLLLLLGDGAKTRAAVLRQLRLNIRGFYRDLEVLRAVGVPVEHNDGHYVLATDVAEALERLPFPDPCLTVADARLLAKGKSSAHRKIRRRLSTLEKA
jgi:predicted DNA-binding transcriptional regulator YafY